ncbi:MAG: prepilin-type N-terminal cleavage/methylation domain-containing protein [Planctomycetes bacterium]|nr:prepilin-type N-terminal cleavage/methylation domain-containing protein [Planctomycetota bacterium]
MPLPPMTNKTHKPSTSHRPAVRIAFTLIELLIVIVIIGIVIAITLPALGGARNASKQLASRNLARDLSGAIAQFETDKRRLPGHFGAAEMGGPDNAIRGFTTLENALLDLTGGIVDPSSSLEPGSVITVGPSASLTVEVDLDLIGAGTGDDAPYFIPTARNYIAQDGEVGGLQAGTEDHQALPDLVDAFNSPFLLWLENPSAKNARVLEPGATTGVGVRFTRIHSGTRMNDAARFYWNSNAGFLNSTKLGSLGRSQVGSGPGRYSLIGGGVTELDRAQSLMGLLGNPSNANVGMTGVAYDETLPAAARGLFIIQSAGPDGVFVSSRDNGASRFDGIIEYWRTWYVDKNGTRVTDENDKPSSVDIIEDFDDIIVSGGN